MRHKILNIIVNLCFFLSFINLNAQEYDYDQLYEYQENSGRFYIIMTSSKDTTHYFFGISSSNKIAGSIIDTKRKTNHYYDIKNKTDGLFFEYIDSNINNYKYDHQYYIYDYKKDIKKDTLSDFITITKYRRKIKEKLKEATIEIKYSKNDDNSFFPIQFYEHFFHGFFWNFQNSKIENKAPKTVTLTKNKQEKTNVILNKNININIKLNTTKTP